MWWIQTITNCSQEAQLVGRHKAILGPMYLATLYRPGPANDVHTHFKCAYMLQNQLFASGTSQSAEMTFTRTTYMSNSLLQNKRQTTPQEFGERSLWRVLVSYEMASKIWKRYWLQGNIKKERDVLQSGGKKRERKERETTAKGKAKK